MMCGELAYTIAYLVGVKNAEIIPMSGKVRRICTELVLKDLDIFRNIL
jgi:hypothetical protein